MSNLSPRAQAVLDAFLAEWPDESLKQDRWCLAAALRAAADQVVPESTGISYTKQDIRTALLAIADELEGAQ
jgi:hypothetical protein